MYKPPVSISLSSYGADLVRERGQGSFIDVLAAADATRIEWREELLTVEAPPAPRGCSGAMSAMCTAKPCRAGPTANWSPYRLPPVTCICGNNCCGSPPWSVSVGERSCLRRYSVVRRNHGLDCSNVAIDTAHPTGFSSGRALTMAAIRMRDAGRSESFDPNLRPSLWASTQQMITEINRLAALAHWIPPGLSEGRLLTGFEDPADIAAFYLDLGAEAVAIKLGPHGAYYRTHLDQSFVAGVPVETVVDTVGCRRWICR